MKPEWQWTNNNTTLNAIRRALFDDPGRINSISVMVSAVDAQFWHEGYAMLVIPNKDETTVKCSHEFMWLRERRHWMTIHSEKSNQVTEWTETASSTRANSREQNVMLKGSQISLLIFNYSWPLSAMSLECLTVHGITVRLFRKCSLKTYRGCLVFRFPTRLLFLFSVNHCRI